MRIRIIIFTLLFCVFALNTKAQGVIKINPFAIFFSLIDPSYEHNLSFKTSIQVRGNITRREFIRRHPGFGLEGQYRIYWTERHEAPKGFYYAPLLAISFNSYYDDNRFFGGGRSETIDYTLVKIGTTVGYQWVFSDQFTFELGVGFTYGRARSRNLNLNALGDGFELFGRLSMGCIIGAE